MTCIAVQSPIPTGWRDLVSEMKSTVASRYPAARITTISVAGGGWLRVD